MTKALKIIKVGNSVGVLLPRDVLTKLRVELGDELFLSETQQGFQISGNDPAFIEAMTAAERVMKEDRDILAVLAR
jgi:putative addiction module antidote